jgi:hypothetical protein
MMAEFTEQSMNIAWSSLWSDSVYNLSNALGSGKRQGLIWFRALQGVSFPNTGPVVVANSEPWGIVALDFQANEVSQLDRIVPGDVQFANGKFEGKISFTELKLAGDYVVRRGRATGSALKSAALSLRGPVADGEDDNIVLASSYRDQLTASSSGSGRFMVGTYYDNNDAYAQCFQNQTFLTQWQTWETNGKNTGYFAQQTNNAAQSQNANTVQVNADPDYNTHAFTMQNLVYVTCKKMGNQAAANAAASFSCGATAPAGSPQTVNDVVTMVQNTPPPSQDPCSQQSLTAPRAEAAIDRLPVPGDPRIQAALEKLKPVIDAIEKEEDDVARGLILRENTERPIYGKYRAYFPAGPLTISGEVSSDEQGNPKLQCTRISGPTPEPDIRLGIFPGELYPKLQAELEKAAFLRAVLGQKAVVALSSPKFLGYVSRMLTLAAGNRLSRITG